MRATPPSPDVAALRAGLALAQVPGIGCVSFRAQVERHGSAAAAFQAESRGRERDEALRQADDLLARTRACGASVVLFGEPGYPESLLDLSQAPSVCYALGRSDVLETPMVAIVGTRRSSEAGERVARRLAGELARRGLAVVSGMARGIDAAAHRGALDAGGVTVAVLAGGVDVPYPREHRALHAEISRTGLVLSEAPPGTSAIPGSFPRRNRIIAALARALIVIEAGERSGAIGTAREAMALGRAVGAVPGWFEAPRAVGCHTLLRDGATLVADLDDALLLAGVSGTRARREPGAAEDVGALPLVSDPITGEVLRALDSGATTIEELGRVTGLPARELGVAITTLEMAGVVWSDHHGAIRAAR